jgi:hypothetical protein
MQIALLVSILKHQVPLQLEILKEKTKMNENFTKNIEIYIDMYFRKK